MTPIAYRQETRAKFPSLSFFLPTIHRSEKTDLNVTSIQRDIIKRQSGVARCLNATSSIPPTNEVIDPRLRQSRRSDASARARKALAYVAAIRCEVSRGCDSIPSNFHVMSDRAF